MCFRERERREREIRTHIHTHGERERRETEREAHCMAVACDRRCDRISVSACSTIGLSLLFVGAPRAMYMCRTYNFLDERKRRTK